MNFGSYGIGPQGPAVPTFTPGGYLSVVPSSSSTSPIPTTDQSAKTAVYYRPDKGNAFPVLRNGVFEAVTFQDDLVLTLTSAHTASAIFDVFGTFQGGEAKIGTGPAWDTATAGSGDRGSDPGDTELERCGGLLVNRWGIPCLNAEGSFSLQPREGIYLGSLFMDGTNGQISCLPEYGQARKWGPWNAFNRRLIVMKAGDATASWTYTTATLRAANNDSDNSLTVFTGLDEEFFDVQLYTNAQNDSTDVGLQNAIGWNSTSTASGVQGKMSSGATTKRNRMHAIYEAPPDLGINVATALELSAASGTSTWYGDENDMALVARYYA